MTLLPKETINDTQSLDAIFTEMHKAQKVPMTDEQARWSIPIMAGGDSSGAYNDLCKLWQFAGFFKRCEMFPIKYSKHLLVWLGVMTHEYGIGAMILNAYYVQWAAYRYLKLRNAINGDAANPDDTIELDFVTEVCFPDGIFSKQTLHEFWDKQKVAARPDNLIDYPSAGLSFMPIERTEPINSSDMVF